MYIPTYIVMQFRPMVLIFVTTGFFLIALLLSYIVSRISCIFRVARKAGMTSCILIITSICNLYFFISRVNKKCQLNNRMLRFSFTYGIWTQQLRTTLKLHNRRPLVNYFFGNGRKCQIPY